MCVGMLCSAGRMLACVVEGVTSPCSLLYDSHAMTCQCQICCNITHQAEHKLKLKWTFVWL
jgi:hypothetical protein